MQLPAAVIEAFNDSLDLCVADPTFFDRFYDRFTAVSEEVASLFRTVPMARQKRALKASLYTTLMAADGNEPALAHLRALGDLHRRMGIRRGHYDLWLACLVATVDETPAIDGPAVREAWQRVLERAVDLMADPPPPGDRKPL